MGPVMDDISTWETPVFPDEAPAGPPSPPSRPTWLDAAHAAVSYGVPPEGTDEQGGSRRASTGNSEGSHISGSPRDPSGTDTPVSNRLVEFRRLAHLDEYQHSSHVPLALFLMMFFILGMVWLRFTRSSAEPKKRSRKAKANDAMPRNSPVELSF